VVGWWVGRKKGGSWVGVGRSFPKKNLGPGVGQKKIDKKTVPRGKKKKKTELGEKSLAGKKKEQKEKK
jgi:hypothetical protein